MAVDVIKDRILILIKTDAVEDKELKFGSEKSCIGDAGRLHVVDRLARDEARVPAIILPRERILDAANEDERRFLEERIDECGLGLRDDEHVGFVDRLPAANAGTIEAEAVLKGGFINL